MKLYATIIIPSTHFNGSAIDRPGSVEMNRNKALELFDTNSPKYFFDVPLNAIFHTRKQYSDEFKSKYPDVSVDIMQEEMHIIVYEIEAPNGIVRREYTEREIDDEGNECIKIADKDKKYLKLEVVSTGGKVYFTDKFAQQNQIPLEIDIPKDELNKSAETRHFFNTINMQVLGGFIAVLGAAAVAVAFIALNAATFGLPGLIMAAVGIAALVAGIGFFIAGTIKKHENNTEDIHTTTINVGASLGYLEEDAGGICHGITLNWLMASMVNEGNRFEKRISKIVNDKYLIHKIELVRDKVRHHGKLSNNELDLLEILSFYESIVLRQYRKKYTKISSTLGDKSDTKLEEKISKFTSSKKLEAMGGFTTVYSESVIYTEDEIDGYLKSILQAINSINYKHGTVIGFILSSDAHTIGLNYNTSLKQWTVFNINTKKWPPKVFSQNDTKKIAKTICHSFENKSKFIATPLCSIPKPASPYTAFTTQVITTANDTNLHELTSKLAKLNDSHVITKEITERKADVSLAFLAAANGDIHLLQLLIENGANLGLTDSNGETVAHKAARNGHADIIALLAEQHLSILDIPNNDGCTPIYLAVSCGYAEVVTLLIKHGANQDTSIYDSEPLIHTATRYGYTVIISILAGSGANLNAQNRYGETPAYVAVDKGEVPALEELAKLGANLDIPDNQGRTPAHIAIQHGRSDALTILTHHGVKLPSQNEYSEPIGYFAAQYGYLDTLVILAKNGVNIEQPFVSKADSLRVSIELLEQQVRYRMDEFIEAQIAAGVDPELISILPEQIAYIMGHEEVVHLYKKLRPIEGNTNPSHRFFGPTSSQKPHQAQDGAPIEEQVSSTSNFPI